MLKSLYLSTRFFIAMGCIIAAFILCFSFPALFLGIVVGMGGLFAFFIIDAFSIYRLPKGVEGERNCPDRLSNGDLNPVSFSITNHYSFPAEIKVVEEIPFQFQRSDMIFNSKFKPGETKVFHYNLRPTERGEYEFGNINVFVSGIFGFFSRRYIVGSKKTVAVYPSFLEMKRYELLAELHRLTDYGVKHIRRIGHSTEFDQIKQYVTGDDPRTINHKASARANQLMVNAYQDEKSQPVYCLIDKGRTMKMPFNGMTLLDYAINSTLMLVSTALNKGDKAGLITFSNTVDRIVPADKNRKQRNVILETLYAQETNFKESDYERLYVALRRSVTQRSLIVLFTNFETINGIKRQMKFLSRLAKDHLVLVSFFHNSEFDEILNTRPNDLFGTFRKGMAEKLSNDKQLIVKELNSRGVQTILSKPEELTIDSINKYLEIKSRNLI